MSYKAKHAETQEYSTEYRCAFCRCVTTFETLATNGARCEGCYQAYRAHKPTYIETPKSAVPAGAGFRDWAYRLKWRHQNEGLNGERLTRAQVTAYQSVLKEVA